MAVKTLTRTAIDTTKDPLAEVTAPPAFETDDQREKRLEGEREAKRVSDVIDEQIDKERRADKPLKILLLGESS